MKKMLVCCAAIAMLAAPAFAGTDVTMDLANTTGLTLYGADGTAATADTGGTLLARASTGVGFGALVDAGGNGYAVVSQHKSGTKAFGSSYDSTAIFITVADSEPGTAALTVPTATDTTDFAGTDWKKM